MKFVSIFLLTFVMALCAARELNDKSLDFIKDFEKWMPCAYSNDGANRLTIGYGHLIVPGDGFNKNSCITKEIGLNLLRSDLSIATKCIEKIVRVKLSDNQFGALVSWTFNVGCGAATQSTVVEKLNAGAQADEICNELRQWNKVTINGKLQVSQGLVRRREGECTLYKS